MTRPPLRMPRERPYGLDVAPEVVVQLLLRQVQEGLDAPSRVVVVDVDGKEVADVGHVDDAAARERRLLFALVVDPFRVHRRVLVHEVEGERVGLLADQVQSWPSPTRARQRLWT